MYIRAKITGFTADRPHRMCVVCCVFKLQQTLFRIKMYRDANMNILLFLTIITASLQLVSPAPTHMQEFEMLMLNQLNKSWYKPKPPHEYPLKGEYPCEGGICRTETRRRLFKD
ncbi:uncharacterized protein LOC113493856 [Trichoplusia ni]|uniref:Uncharacterized protein LOC113493856 n=1 Tax=Trichoplusia ni TaxID=7111 RepID=A0A7E5VHG5_TRINI|nr:uncharacterized protein LOC113493856 [Trichoplusia ni]